MNKFIAIAALAAALTGCATAPTNLPSVDVSKMPNGKVLTAVEIKAAISGKQMVGDIIRTSGPNSYGYNSYDVVYVFEPDGTIKGAWPAGREYPSGYDQGKWTVNQTTNELCNSWLRLSSPCYVVSNREGKLHLYRGDNNSYYLQK